jgi:CheY-like chemotaxis protein
MIGENSLPFDFMHNTIRLLVIDDEPEVLEMTAMIVEPIPIYSVHCAKSNTEALKVIEELDRVHLCITDLGICDIENDECYLLKKCAGRIHFVVLTGSTSIAKGYQLHQIGARAVLEKATDIGNERFFDVLKEQALLSIIYPHYSLNNPDTLDNAVDVLFTKNPSSVTRWALDTNISDREMRNIWKNAMGINARTILFLYQAYTAAFEWFHSALIADASEGKTLREMPTPENYEHIRDYFTLHRSTLLHFIDTLPYLVKS